MKTYHSSQWNDLQLQMTTSLTMTTTTTINYYNHTTLQHPGTCTRLRPPVSQITNHSIILGRVVFSGRIAASFRPHTPSLSHITAAADVDASLKQTFCCSCWDESRLLCDSRRSCFVGDVLQNKLVSSTCVEYFVVCFLACLHYDYYTATSVAYWRFLAGHWE